MKELAINGGTPVRSTDYPAWPVVDERGRRPSPMWSAAASGAGFPEPGGTAAFEEAFAAYQGAPTAY